LTRTSPIVGRRDDGIEDTQIRGPLDTEPAAGEDVDCFRMPPSSAAVAAVAVVAVVVRW